MPILNLRHAETRRAMALPMIAGLPRLGRGSFCVVFDKGDTVIKLTRDSVQYGFYTNLLLPNSQYLPRLVEDFGMVGKQDDFPLYAVEMEKLQRIDKRTAPGAWEMRKRMFEIADAHRDEHVQHLWNTQNPVRFENDLAQAILLEMSCDMRLPARLRSALYAVKEFLDHTTGSLDMHRGNVMARGGVLVLNDIVADAETIQADRSKKTIYVTR